MQTYAERMHRAMVAADRARTANPGCDVSVRGGRVYVSGVPRRDIAETARLVGHPVVARRANKSPSEIAQALADAKLERIKRTLRERFGQDDPEGFDAVFADLAVELAPALVDKYAQVIAQAAESVEEDVDKASAEGFGAPDEPRTEAKRRDANIEAMKVAASIPPDGTPTAEQRRIMRQYSGFGGINSAYEQDARGNWTFKQKYADQIPAAFPQHEMRGLIYEYYTPSIVCEQVRRVLRPYVTADALLDAGETRIRALEPSAGIGRFVEPWRDQHDIDWSLVEYSGVSSTMLEKLYVDANVYGMALEEATADHYDDWFQSFHLLVSNPPYGQRGGAEAAHEPDPRFRSVRNPYHYFVSRTIELLAPGGIGVYLVPGGLLTGVGSTMFALREEMLRRCHLMGAFRLPSDLFPGANLVLDVIFLRARGGELVDLDPKDRGVLQGAYYTEFPDHILGVEVGKEDYDDSSTPGAQRRSRYRVVGEFERLPDLVEREPTPGLEINAIVKVAEDDRVVRPKGAAGLGQVPVSTEAFEPIAELDALSTRAINLGERLTTYLEKRNGSPDDQNHAAMMHAELLADIDDVLDNFEPFAHEPLKELAEKGFVGASAFLTLEDPEGDARKALETPPKERMARHDDKDAGAVAEAMRRFVEGVSVADVVAALGRSGVRTTEQAVVERLCAPDGGWCLSFDGLVAARDYYTGDLWRRYDEASAFARQHPHYAAIIERQREEIYRRIEPVEFDEIDFVAPTASFVPTWTVTEWLRGFDIDDYPWSAEFENSRLRQDNIVAGVQWRIVDGPNKHPMLEVRRGGVWQEPEARDYSVSKSDIPRTVLEVYGWMIGDKGLFRPYSPQDAQRPPQVNRQRYADFWTESFHAFAESQPDVRKAITDAYNRVARGWVNPDYPTELPYLARWTGPFQAFPHQAAGALRAVDQGGSLLAFDVGVGKSLTGCAIIALSRQNEGTRRPVLIVPNTLALKWALKDFNARCLGDYNVVTIGVERYEGRGGVIKSRTEPSGEDRARKWRQFQAGLYDVAVVTLSSFKRCEPSEDALEAYVSTLTGRKRAAKEEKKGKAMTARQAAVSGEKVSFDVADRLKLPAKQLPDPGVTWDAIGVDLLMADEAQAFKNLYGPGDALEDAMYLGDPGETSVSWHFDLRAWLCRQRGGYVHLLSATPAKNSPLEYYNLLQYINPSWFERRGIMMASQFARDFVQTRAQPNLRPDGTIAVRDAVYEFRNLHELRTLIFRYGNFLSAQDVPRVRDRLPEARTVRVDIEAEGEQLKAINAFKRVMKAMQMRLDNPETFMDVYGITNPLKLDAEFGKQEAAGIRLAGMTLMSIACTHPALTEGRVIESRLGGLADQPVPVIATRDDSVDQRSVILAGIASGRIDPRSSKFDAVIANIMANRNGAHLVFFESVAGHELLKAALVKAGFPEDRIGIMNAVTAPTIAEREALATAYNGDEMLGEEPTIDVLIANKVAYEGVDLQVRTIGMHHVDLPWEPATLQQRNGRGLRQGNEKGGLTIWYYLIGRSMEGYRFQAINQKAGWMDNVVAGTADSVNNPAASDDLRNSDFAYLSVIADDPAEAEAYMQQFREAREAAELATVRQLNAKRFAAFVALYDKVLTESDAIKVDAARQRMTTLREQLEEAAEENHFQYGYAFTAVDAGDPVRAAVGAAPMVPGLWYDADAGRAAVSSIDPPGVSAGTGVTVLVDRYPRSATEGPRDRYAFARVTGEELKGVGVSRRLIGVAGIGVADGRPTPPVPYQAALEQAIASEHDEMPKRFSLAPQWFLERVADVRGEGYVSKGLVGAAPALVPIIQNDTLRYIRRKWYGADFAVYDKAGEDVGTIPRDTDFSSTYVIWPTLEGFARFVERLPDAKMNHDTASVIALNWFGRKLPKGAMSGARVAAARAPAPVEVTLPEPPSRSAVEGELEAYLQNTGLYGMPDAIIDRALDAVFVNNRARISRDGFDELTRELRTPLLARITAIKEEREAERERQRLEREAERERQRQAEEASRIERLQAASDDPLAFASAVQNELGVKAPRLSYDKTDRGFYFVGRFSGDWKGAGLSWDKQTRTIGTADPNVAARFWQHATEEALRALVDYGLRVDMEGNYRFEGDGYGNEQAWMTFIDETFVWLGGFSSRTIPKQAGMKFNDGFFMAWSTKSPAVAERLAKYADARAQRALGRTSNPGWRAPYTPPAPPSPADRAQPDFAYRDVWT